MAANTFEVEARCQLALEVAQLGVWSWDVGTDAIELDPLAAEIWGLANSQPLSMTLLNAQVHPDDRDRQQATLVKALEPHGPGHYLAEQRVIRRARGDTRQIIMHGKTEFRDGKALRVIGIVRDVTEHRQAEEQIRRSKARLSGIVEIAADAIISVDGEFRISMFNHGAESIFGYQSDEVVGQPLDMLLPERFRSRHNDHIRRFASTDVPARRMAERGEILGLRKCGQEFPAEASISRLEIGGERTFTVVLRDITARKAAERALEQANQILESRVSERTQELLDEIHRREMTQAALSKAQRMEAFGQLTGGIAHDFNNLLTVISGNQELLEMRLKDPKDLALLKRAQVAADMGARLTGRLLTFARRRKLEPLLLNLNELIIGMVELLRRSIGEQITLTTDLAPQLGNVRVDPSEIENAVLNLAINARDAMPNGGALVIETGEFVVEPGEIRSEVKLPPGEYVRLSVTDTGTGMTPEVLSRAFEPFFTTKPPGQGTGLGLSTIYGFVQQSGGNVTIYSELARGTTINIYLPRVATAGPPISLSEPGAMAGAGRGEKILLVEDRTDVREVTRLRLLELGYEVVEAENGRNALVFLQTTSAGQIDLVFSDIVMPGGVSGFDVARWVAANRPSTKVILTSGFSEPVASAAEGETPSIKILRKPYNRSELARTLREALSG